MVGEDLFDLRNSLDETINEAAAYLGRGGTVDEVARRAKSSVWFRVFYCGRNEHGLHHA
jgi:hypothetical protein